MAAALSDVAHMRVVPVSGAGAQRGWTLLDQVIRDVSPNGFIAIDTEFSGLGADPKLNDKDLSIRYEAWRELAEKRAILSLGVSVFNPMEHKSDAAKAKGDRARVPDGKPKEITKRDSNTVDPKSATPAKKSAAYSVTTLEFLLRCNSPFEIVADAGAFLAVHGFDFNDMFCNGIGYHRASSDKAGKNEDSQSVFRWGPYPRGLLWRLGRSAVPIVTHNGLMDLVLLYTSFHGPLPKTLNEFVSKLLDCVPAGFWDTKILAMGPGNESVSFLNYVYAHAVMQDRVRVANRKNLPPDQTTRPTQQVPVVKTELCPLYAMRGYCKNGTRCPDIHDPFMVVERKQNGTLPTDIKQARKLYKKQVKKAKAAARLKEEERKKKPKLNKKARARLVAAELAERARQAEDEMQAAQALQTKDPDNKEQAEIEGNPEANEEHSKLSVTGRKRLRSEHGKDNLGNDQPQKAFKSFPNLKSPEPAIASIGSGDGEDVMMEATNKLLSSARYEQSLKERAHSAGWDAFCTGYAFANYRLTLSKDKLEGLRNRINLVKKKTPLFLCKSMFADPVEARFKESEEESDSGKQTKESELELTEAT